MRVVREGEIKNGKSSVLNVSLYLDIAIRILDLTFLLMLNLLDAQFVEKISVLNFQRKWNKKINLYMRTNYSDKCY